MSSLSSRLLGQVKSTLQIGNDYSVEPAGLSWRSNTFFIVSTVAVGLFTDLFLYGLIVPILPTHILRPPLRPATRPNISLRRRPSRLPRLSRADGEPASIHYAFVLE